MTNRHQITDNRRAFEREQRENARRQKRLAKIARRQSRRDEQPEPEDQPTW
ncbi:MAG TPA: hypothetical protein VJ850_09025 [Candidatus Limnocylindrales bacterium]|nr:hypothetical protein [Candidatus Limnocylindrales bacterium]